MIRMSITVLAIVILVVSIGALAEDQPSSRWPYGFWVAVMDEDNGPLDFMEIRSDGRVVLWGICRNGHSTRGESLPFHLSSGDIYVTWEVPGKGPIALVFRPNTSKTKLTYTSPRTRNNMYYEYRAAKPCPAA